LETKLNTGRLHYFDGLRAVACLLIIAHHTITSALVKGLDASHFSLAGKYLSNFTQSGVEIFFLLSGILLLRPYFSGKKEFKPIDYYYRRFKRIYIPYFFAVLFGGFVVWINTSYPTWYSTIIIDFRSWGLIKQFFLFNLEGNYYNLAWWSLQIEVLFYLTVPIILWLFSDAKFIPSIIITFIFSLFLQWIAIQYLPDYYSIHKIILGPVRIVDYLLCFILGVFLAKDTFNVRQAAAAIILGIMFQVISFWYEPFDHMGFAFLYFGILVLIFHSQFLQNILSSPLMVWIGERSYSLFLVHFSVLYLTNYMISYFVEDRNLLYGLLSRSFGIIFSFFAAMALFHFVERKQARGLQTENQFWPPLFSKKS
jgi:peptidoglycan/LPS O-acetylase OafA/YrhL